MYLYVRNVITISDNKSIDFTERSIAKDKFERGDFLYVNIPETHSNIRIRKKDVISIIDDEIICSVDKKYKVILSKG